MPYIGNTIRAADDYRLIDDISSGFNGSATSFALQVAGSSPVPFPKSPQQILVSVNGVIQEPDPTGASGFNLVGTNIVFSSAPTNGHAFFGIIYATADYLNAGGEFPAGSVGAPSFTFIGDQDTGIYRKGSGSIGFVSNATEIANTDSNGITISSGNLILGDSSGSSDDRIKLGASGDLELYHNGSDSFIVDQGTGVLVIQGSQTKIRNEQGHTQINASNDVVELYYDNSKKFETTRSGVTVTGTINFGSGMGSGLNSNGFNINFADSDGAQDMAKFGNDGDLRIYHTGSVSVIQEAGTGGLQIRTNNLTLANAANSESILVANENGAVELYYDNSKKFETRSNGIEVLGHALLGDNYRLGLGNVGSNGDIQIYHDGTDSIIDNNTGNLNLVCDSAQAINLKHGSENMIRAITDGAVELYYDNSKKLETVSDGAHMTRELRVAGTSVNDFESGRVRLTEGGEQMLGGYIHYDGAANLLHLGTHPQSDSTVGNDVDAITMNRTSGSNDVKLLYNGSTKLQTTSNGASITGRLDLSGNLDMPDDAKIVLGTGDDLKIYSDGSTVFYAGDDQRFRNKALNENFLTFAANGAVTAFYDGSNKFETTNTGISVTGNIAVTGTVDGVDIAALSSSVSGKLSNVVDDTSPQLGNSLDMNGQSINGGDSAGTTSNRIKLGASDDLQIYHDGSNSVIAAANTGDLQIFANADDILLQAVDNIFIKPQSGESGITVIGNGAVELYYDNSKKLETISTGVTVTGRINSSSFGSQGDYSGQFGRVRIGTDVHGNTIRCITDTNLNIAANNTVAFYIGGAVDGTSFGTGIANFNSGGLSPAANNTFDLGSSSYRWRDLYTNDLNLSNEGSSNDVDGTWGSYTIQEGAEDLFLINKRSGKKYKFNLTEVS